jgi:hypothetical protein
MKCAQMLHAIALHARDMHVMNTWQMDSAAEPLLLVPVRVLINISAELVPKLPERMYI